MANYGRNFEYLQSPDPLHRLGRFRLEDGLSVPIGVPVQVPSGAEPDANGRLPLELVTGATAPLTGFSGLAIYEHNFNWDRGVDPAVTNRSDLDTCPVAAPVQLCYGVECKVRFTNTFDRVFRNMRNYAGRIFVAGMGATPTVAVGNLLTPGTGDDANGYWAETSDEDLAWFRVTAVGTNHVEAQQLF